MHIINTVYEVCKKSNGTVHPVRTTFIAEKKALLSISQCRTVSKTKFQHSVTTTFFFARFSVKGLSLRPFCENLIKLRSFGFFFPLVRRMSVEQPINLKFLVRLGKTPTEALKLLQEVYGDDMSKTRLFEWLMRFREDEEDDHTSRRISTSRTDENVERMRQKVRSDRSLTVRITANEMGMKDHYGRSVQKW